MNYEIFYNNFLNLADDDTISKNELLKLLKEYSSQISVFDLMNLITQSDNTFEGVSEKWKVLGNKMQVATFIFRMKNINEDSNLYEGFIDSDRLNKFGHSRLFFRPTACEKQQHRNISKCFF